MASTITITASTFGTDIFTAKYYKASAISHTDWYSNFTQTTASAEAGAIGLINSSSKGYYCSSFYFNKGSNAALWKKAIAQGISSVTLTLTFSSIGSYTNNRFYCGRKGQPAATGFFACGVYPTYVTRSSTSATTITFSLGASPLPITGAYVVGQLNYAGAGAYYNVSKAVLTVTLNDNKAYYIPATARFGMAGASRSTLLKYTTSESTSYIGYYGNHHATSYFFDSDDYTHIAALASSSIKALKLCLGSSSGSDAFTCYGGAKADTGTSSTQISTAYAISIADGFLKDIDLSSIGISSTKAYSLGTYKDTANKVTIYGSYEKQYLYVETDESLANIHIFNGSSLVDGKIYYFNGTSLVEAELYYFDGTSLIKTS